MTKKLLPWIFILASLSGFCQLKGRITDQNQVALPAVNIYIENTFTGTTSNDKGDYELNLSTPGTYRVVFQFLGYKTVKKEVAIKHFPYHLDATLIEAQIFLDEVIINSNENPADKIIKKAIAARKINMEKIHSFTADFYSRGLIRIKNAPEKFFGQALDEFLVGLDSARNGILYLSETISEIEYLHPDKLKEKIIASKVSGNDNGFSFNTASDANFNFYNNTIALGNAIISPIADYAFNYYRYKLEGTFYDDKGHLINKIRVLPRRDNDRVFSGSIYIAEHQWNIYALELAITGAQAQIPPAETITIKQNFAYSETNSVWALLSQDMDFSYSLFGFKGDGRFTAVYSNYNFNYSPAHTAFGKEILAFAKEANKKDSTYWNTIRPVPLTDEERQDYLFKDSIQAIRASKPYLDSIDAKNNKYRIWNLLSGYQYRNSFKEWSVGYSAALSNFQFNTVQGYNPNLTLYYRKNKDKNRRFFVASSSLSYGISDNRLRGTAAFTYKFNNINKPFFMLSGGIETKQFNTSAPISPLLNSISSLFFENNFMKIYDRSFVETGYTQELTNSISFYGTLAYERRKALLNSTDQVFFNNKTKTYSSNNPQDPTGYGILAFDTHNLITLNINTRIHFDQDYLSYPDSKINLPSSKYPTLYLNYKKGMGASKSGHDFNHLSARVTQNFNIENKGDLKYNLKAGTFFNAPTIAFMDYYHPNGNQTHIGTSDSYLNTFNNLPYYALSTNGPYFEMHAEHDFKGFLLGRLPVLNQLQLNLVIGIHAFATEHQKPYQEYAIGIDNIGFKKFRFLRIDYVRSYQQGYRGDAVVFGLKFLSFIE